MSDGYWVPQYKDQLVKQVKGLLSHVRLDNKGKGIERMNKKNLYGLRKELIAELKCGRCA